MKTLLALLIFSTFLIIGCASKPAQNTVQISTASLGLVKNPELQFPLVLTDKLESKDSFIEKYGKDVIVIHTGHLLKALAKKEDNLAVLQSLKDKKIDFINLSIEDFIIADQQEINLEEFPQQFLNSSVVNLNEDNIIEKANIKPFAIIDGVALIGLSDRNIDKLLSLDKFIVSDYVLALLRARKLAVKTTPPPHTYVIVHTLGAEINEVMERLPPNFINSLAD